MASKVHGLDTTGLLLGSGSGCARSGSTDGTGGSNEGALLSRRSQLAGHWAAQSLRKASGGHFVYVRSGDGYLEEEEEAVWEGKLEEPGLYGRKATTLQQSCESKIQQGRAWPQPISLRSGAPCGSGPMTKVAIIWGRSGLHSSQSS